MKSFLKICFGISLVLLSAGFLLRSVQPVFALGIDETKNPEASSIGLGSEKLLYVDIDTVNLNYKAFQDLAKEAGDSYAKKQKEYQKKALDLQDRYDRYQRQVQMGTITSSTAMLEEQAIAYGMDNLKFLEEEIAAMEAEAMEKNAKITTDITLMLKGFAAEKGVDFIFAYGGATNLLYADSRFDVTDEVLAKLNTDYEKKRK
ncbi:MAG: OmpH family outer membrane protein [Bacteroidota bacterium]|nr:OmpH family outer membrane protein [Bacteroidota bacterium]